MTKFATIIVSTVVFLSLGHVIALAQSPTTASSTQLPIYGWAWSPNIGWISLNSGNTSSGGGSYGLNMDSSGNITGYAWSASVGWIKFGSLSGFPSSGFSATNAKVNLSTGAVLGWARAWDNLLLIPYCG